MLHILYTEEEGGEFREFHYIAENSDEKTRELFEETIKSKRLLFSIGDRTINITPAYICLVETKEDFDFVLGRTRIEPPKYSPIIEAQVEITDKKEGEGKNDQ